MVALSLRGIVFSYLPRNPLIQNISFEVSRGEILGIVGPNGSGKSTLLKLCSRILLPEKGNISLLGKDIETYSRNGIAKKLAVVGQDNVAEFPFTALEVVLMGRSPHTRGLAFESEKDLAIARSAMTKTDTSHLADRPVTTLSGGERQSVLIARALAQEPEVLLLDEPNAHLDIAHQVEVFNLLKQTNAERGTTIVAVSHDLNLAASFSDRIAVMTEGTLAAIGTPDDVLTEERLREVFHTEVLIDRHPVHQAPRITLVGGGRSPAEALSSRLTGEGGRFR